jgi:DNA-binding LacI/PurR family transcriptional regulator
MATVSRVVNGKADGQISSGTQARIRQVADDLGYEPNRLARSLQSSKSRIIGILVGRIGNPYFAKMLEIAEEQAVAAGYQVISSSLHPSVAARYGRMRGWPVDGALVWATPGVTLESYFGSAAKDVPVVYMGHRRDDAEDCVFLDLYRGTQELMAHLIARGYRRIAMAAPHMDQPSVYLEERPMAYREACAKAGLPLIPISLKQYKTAEGDLFGESQRQMGYSAGVAIAATPAGERPDAVFCYNDAIALGMREGLQRGGLSIPQDVAVAGCDGLEEGQYLSQTLTTIDTPVVDICKAGMELLMNRIENGASLGRQTARYLGTLRVGETT